ncbi:anti-phage deoxyguanosine triphosphatase [Vibrio nitrifigilis]|uniref:Deoxyguanosinetriphosphate triphosphohydrolase-like protein n=1 Tax=Vibrio nitrifigilis TaxID=2789781 RepID=A0ABS0GB39_9VIBR|nr:anti-phage deoxyguanosine triphosphatase [Vibrio nitrifigilis]MBF8999640.1 deoxyguanosinetriphosphate triphosphohydrolase family protein [Vibrio nitrifigilis]
MPFSIDERWQERNNDEHKIRRNDHRSPFQRDRARVLHSAAFRRLQAKTQVHGTNLNDFHRTRLTHSLEVAQIGTGIVAQLKNKQPEFRPLMPSDSLIDSLCLAHDIGHPPFGHGGEIALNFMMREHGGFEGNAQTFRIVTSLEPYTEHHGMNLARRTLLGLLKYPALLSETRAEKQAEAVTNPRQLKARDWMPAKGLYDCDKALFDWVCEPLSADDKQRLGTMREAPNSPYEHRKTQYKSLDCSIMELADDIAYGVHDLEDAIVLGMVTRSQWDESAHLALSHYPESWFASQIDELTNMLFSGKHYIRKDAIGGIVNALLTSISVEEVAGEFTNPLLAYNAYLAPEMAYALEVLKKFVNQYVIHIPQVQRFEYKGQQMIMDLFEALSADPERLLPDATREKWLEAEAANSDGMRVLCDYIAAMTDGYAQRLHQELFSC